jgi:hypothetical protein
MGNELQAKMTEYRILSGECVSLGDIGSEYTSDHIKITGAHKQLTPFDLYSAPSITLNIIIFDLTNLRS